MRNQRYKVKVGTHNQDGKDYAAGDVVVSPLDLSAMFSGKFEKLGPVEVQQRAQEERIDNSDEDEEEEQEDTSEEQEDTTSPATAKPAAKRTTRKKKSSRKKKTGFEFDDDED